VVDRRYKILIVDDDPSALLLMETILKPQGYDLVFQNDGRQVIQVARQEKPDLILLDTMMPIFDGYLILTEIRDDKVLRKIPVVMVTALGQDINKEIARKCGANAYMTKPINYKELIKTVAYFLSGSTSL
jgi:CheY-like chemotaxis protein